MSFWNTDRLVLKQSQKELIQPFDPQFAKQGAYELSLGPEAFITSEPNATKQTLAVGGQLSIPPGQFGLLLTEEVVTIPGDTIAFISVRFTIKRRGLVNVSGFHVDPGFSGRLKFAVYNAGSQNIIVSRGERIFMIWFSDMNAVTPDPYQGKSAGQKEITSQDVMFIQGEVASPAALKSKIDDVKNEFERRLTVLDNKMSVVITLLVTLLVGSLLLILKMSIESSPSPQNQQISPPNINASAPAINSSKQSNDPSNDGIGNGNDNSRSNPKPKLGSNSE
jgi:dCTP deaminase